MWFPGLAAQPELVVVLAWAVRTLALELECWVRLGTASVSLEQAAFAVRVTFSGLMQEASVTELVAAVAKLLVSGRTGASAMFVSSLAFSAEKAGVVPAKVCRQGQRCSVLGGSCLA